MTNHTQVNWPIRLSYRRDFFCSVLQRRCCDLKLPASNSELCLLFSPFQIAFDFEGALRRVFKDIVTQMSPWVSVYDV